MPIQDQFLQIIFQILIRQFIEKYKDQDINIETYAVSTALILNDLKEDKIDFGFCSKGESMDENIKMIPSFNELNLLPMKMICYVNICWKDGAKIIFNEPKYLHL